MPCRSPFWQYDDFDVCHKQRYLELYPLGILLFFFLGYSFFSLIYSLKSKKQPTTELVFHPENSVEKTAKIVIKTRTVSDEIRLYVELIANFVHFGIVLNLDIKPSYRNSFVFAESLPFVHTAVVLYSYFLSFYRTLMRKRVEKLVCSPFMQQSFVYTTLLFVYSIEFYSLKMHPRDNAGAIKLLLLLTLISWTTLFSSPIGDELPRLYSSQSTKPSPEPNSSLFRIVTCNWCLQMILKSQQKTLEMEDVMDLVEQDHVYSFIKRSLKLPRMSFFWRCTLTLWKPISLNVFFGCSASFLKLTPTIFIQQILRFLESKDVPKGVAWLYVFSLGVAYILSDILSNQAFYQGRKLSVGVRAMIMGNVYEKAIYHKVSVRKPVQEDNDDASTAESIDVEDLSQFDSSNTGAVINLMSVDAFKIADFAAYLHDFFATPLIVLLSILFLYRVIGWSAFVAVLAMLVCLPLNVLLASKLNQVQERLMAVTDRRIEKTNEILEAIRIIKLYAWETRFTEKVIKIRDEELRLLLLRYVYWTANCFVFFGMPIVVVISSFWCFVRYQGGTLTTSVAFTALAVFSIMRMPLNELAYIFTQLSSAIVSFKRIQAYLNSDSTTKYEQLEESFDADGEPVIGFENATFSWGELENLEEESFKLRDLNVKFKTNDLNVIVGKTGSGKTSLLLALLGEMQLESGKVFLPKGNRRVAKVNPKTQLANSVAYCPQEAWLMNGTIKQNILFAHKFNKQRYDAVVSACELTRDLEILDKGDQTLIGDKGIALSGGQKQRVSLARAMYSNSQHLVLDDCLSAVDSHTAEAIYNNALCGKIAQNRTIVLVSHNIALTIRNAAQVTCVENGRVVASGSPAEVAQAGHLGNDELVSKNAKGAAASRVNSFANLQEVLVETANPHQQLTVEEDVAEAAVEDEERAHGHVPLSTYKNFLNELTDLKGLLLTFALIGLVAVFEYLENWWVRLWAKNSMPTKMQLYSFIFSKHHLPPIDDDVLYNLKYYSIGYAIIGFFCIITAVAREMIVYYGGVRAAKSIFRKLLFTVVNARTRFFDSTPNGRIVNRFTKDIEIIDQEISANLLWFMISLVDMFQVTLVVSWVTPMLIPLAIVIVYVFMLIGRAYLSAARELKRLESITRSPIFQQFGETISGSILIRAYGDVDRFIADNQNSVDQTHRPYFWLWVSNRWLSFMCGMLSVAVCVGGAAMIVAGSDYIDAGMAGISLSFSTYFGDCVLWVVRMYAECEVSMNSVERVTEYMQIEQEAPAVIPESRPPVNWPSKGTIEFDHLSLRYSDNLPMVINNVTFKIPGGKKVGVVGRTGAGKSTIITALFRLLEPATGKILIDNVDISHIGLHDLRNGLSIIPQEPTLFKGTIRSNLDLFDEHSDLEIFTALSEANLLPPNTTVESALEQLKQNNLTENQNPFFDLDYEVSEGGRNLSQGQRQLLCLARAILKRPKILLLDEATASIDYTTDAIIQNTIRHTFKNSTILTIAHRLRTIADYDLILVLEKGEVAEFGHPDDLLNKGGLFFKMCEKSGELETLRKLASEAREQANERSE